MKQTRVFIECHSLLGDLVLMTPMILALKENRPEFLIDIAVGSEAEIDILRRMGNVINEYYIFNPSAMSRIEIGRFILRLRKNHYDYGFVSVSESPKLGAALLKAIGCKRQIGETSSHPFINYNCRVKSNHCVHRVERNVNLLSGIGIRPQIKTKTLTVENRLRQWARDRVAPADGETIVSICLGTGDFIWKERYGRKIVYNCKKWGYDRYLQLTMHFLKDGCKVVWLGGKKEREELPERLKRFHSESLINMVGETNIKEAMGLLSISDLVIGADTGLIHCAAALDRKTLCIIGATDPEKIHPYSSKAEVIYLDLPCSPCYGTKEAVLCKNRRCLKNISVDTVAARADQMLEK